MSLWRGRKHYLAETMLHIPYYLLLYHRHSSLSLSCMPCLTLQIIFPYLFLCVCVHTHTRRIDTKSIKCIQRNYLITYNSSLNPGPANRKSTHYCYHTLNVFTVPSIYVCTLKLSLTNTSESRTQSPPNYHRSRPTLHATVHPRIYITRLSTSFFLFISLIQSRRSLNAMFSPNDPRRRPPYPRVVLPPRSYSVASQS